MHPFTIRNNKDYMHQAITACHTAQSAPFQPYNSNENVIPLRTEETKTREGRQSVQEWDPGPPDAETCQMITQPLFIPKPNPKTGPLWFHFTSLLK